MLLTAVEFATDRSGEKPKIPTLDCSRIRQNVTNVISTGNSRRQPRSDAIRDFMRDRNVNKRRDGKKKKRRVGLTKFKVDLFFEFEEENRVLSGGAIKFFSAIGDCAASSGNGLIDFLHANVITLTVCNGIAEIS